MRGQAHECSTRAAFFLQAAFFSCSLPLLAPAAQSFSLHSLTFPSGAAGRETVERLLEYREQPRCGQHGKRKCFCTNKCPYSLMRQFFVSYEPINFMLLLSAWAVPDCVEGLSRSTLSARRPSSALGPSRLISTSGLCCLSLLSLLVKPKLPEVPSYLWKDSQRLSWGCFQGDVGALLCPNCLPG